MKQTLGIILLLILAVVWVGAPKSKKKIPFSLGAISSCSLFNEKWECRPLTLQEELETSKALAQSYRYLGGGGQCYALVSEDDKYAIKFFKQKAFVPSSWWRQKKSQKKQHAVFTAFKMSFNHLPKETGTLYVHLNKTSHLGKETSFSDQKGGVHSLHLDNLAFVLQKKAEGFSERIDALMQKGNTQGAKAAIGKLVELHGALYKKGYCNRDPDLCSNCGFIGEEAILFDVGRVVYSTEQKNTKVIRKELSKASPHLQKYLAANHPELLSCFNDAMIQILPPER
jgi:hypothetical protein